MSLPIDTERLIAELEYLARISDTPYPSVTRVLFTSADLRAREWLNIVTINPGPERLRPTRLDAWMYSDTPFG